jgi:hypothetical protein
MLSKKDYIAIADILAKNDVKHYNSRGTITTAGYQWEWIRNALADYFADDNPNFNRERFFMACSLNKT